jgi:hypothetical protein
MVTSHVNGNEVEYKNGKWQYIDFDDAPEAWFDRCSGDGHNRYHDENVGVRYSDTNEVVKGFRPCSKCGHYPNEQGDDWCLGHLGNVLNACCGHGVHKGYIQFDSGVTIRGYFEVEYNDKKV